MKVKLQALTPNVEETIVEIARVSSSRKDKKEQPEGLINYLIKNKHFSPFEHGFITMEITTSKAIGIQLLRHRSFTFQEFSQRYAKVTDIEPIEFRLQAETNRQSSTDVVGQLAFGEASFTLSSNTEVDDNIIEYMNKAGDLLSDIQILYNKMIKDGIAKETARMILPMATQTTIYMTGSVRSWIHMIDIRDDSHAQKEAQEVARACKEVFKENLPLISKALDWK